MNILGADQCPQAQPDMSIGGPWSSASMSFPWGGKSSSCNVTNMAMVAQANMNTSVNQAISSDQKNIMIFKSGGDINIDNSNMDQDVSVDVKALQASYISNQAQQQLMMQALQQASSVSKGLNILSNNSNSTNVMNGYMKAAINMNTNVSQSCSISQENAMVFNAGGDINITDSTLSQQANGTIQCNQVTVDKNVAMQSLTSQLGQIASSTSAGISLLFMVLLLLIAVVFILGLGYEAAQSEWMIPFFIGLFLIFLPGVALLVNNMIPTETYAWYSFSEGIAKSEADCSGMYILGDLKTYANPNYAQDALMADDTLAAFDWAESDRHDGSGTAQFYKYKDGTKKVLTTDVAAKCQTIVNSAKDESQTQGLIRLRPDAYLNLSLNGAVPDATSVVADCVLDVDTGNLWVLMPPGFDDCNSTTYGGAADAKWKFVKPSTVNFSNVDNVYQAISGCTGCTGVNVNCCTAGCSAAAVLDSDGNKIGPLGKNSDAKVYIYINPNTKLDYNLAPISNNNAHNFGSGSYKTLLTSSPDPVFSGAAPAYKWDYDNPIGSKFDIKEGDYYLVVFPLGPTASSTYFQASSTGGPSNVWPTDSGSFEQYSFGQQFALYPVVKDNTSGTYVPYDGAADANAATPPPEPANFLSGTGPSVDVLAFHSTCMKMYIPGDEFGFIMAWVLIAVGVLFMAGGMVMYVAAAGPKKGNTTQVYNQSSIVEEATDGAAERSASAKDPYYYSKYQRFE